MEGVEQEDLIRGRQYYIVCLTEDLNRNLVINHAIEKHMGTFEKIVVNGTYNNYKHAIFKYFRPLVKCNTFAGYEVQLNKLWKYYECKKYKIQCDMENRALNMVLRRIVGDEYFHSDFLQI